ncbi:hypothetical protein ACLOJK_019024 [Asimina triloba]
MAERPLSSLLRLVPSLMASSLFCMVLDSCHFIGMNHACIMPWIAGDIEYGWLGIGRWIVDSRDEDGSWPTTDWTTVKTLPSMMGFWGSHGCLSSSLRSALLIAEEAGSPSSIGSHRGLPQPTAAVAPPRCCSCSSASEKIGFRLPLVAASPSRCATGSGRRSSSPGSGSHHRPPGAAHPRRCVSLFGSGASIRAGGRWVSSHAASLCPACCRLLDCSLSPCSRHPNLPQRRTPSPMPVVAGDDGFWGRWSTEFGAPEVHFDCATVFGVVATDVIGPLSETPCLIASVPAFRQGLSYPVNQT